MQKLTQEGQLCGRTPSCPGTPQTAATRDLEKESFFQGPAYRDRSGPAAILERFCNDLIDDPMRRHQL